MTSMQEPDVAQMMNEMKRAKRRPLLVGAGLLGGLVLLAGLYALGGTSAAREELAQRGYTDAVVTMKVPEHERLEQSLRTQLASLAITEARCAPIAPDATKTTCAIKDATSGPLDLVFTKANDEWTQERADRVLQRAALAETVAKEHGEKVKAQVAVDCGAGLYGYAAGDALSCTRYTWKAKGV